MGDYHEYGKPNQQESKSLQKHRSQRIAVLFASLMVVLLLAFISTHIRGGPGASPAGVDSQSTVSASQGSPDDSTWNTPRPLEQPVAEISPDYRMLSLPANGKVDISYFDTVTFMGDSLTQGMRDYPEGIDNANYCAYRSISPKGFYDGSAWPPRTGETPEVPMDALVASQPDNVYILLGANALAGGISGDAFIEYYRTMLDQVKTNLLPGVNIYIQSLTPVRPEAKYGMDLVRDINNRLAQLAYEENAYFIDLTEPLSGDDGFLKEEYDVGYDGIHLSPAGYIAWSDYLSTHTAYSPGNPYVV